MKYNPSYAGYASLVLHNTTRGNYARILSNDPGNRTITLDAVPGNWQQGDAVTTRSAAIGYNQGDAYYVESMVWAHPMVPAFPVGISLFCWLYAGTTTMVRLRIHALRTRSVSSSGEQYASRSGSTGWETLSGVHVDLIDGRFGCLAGDAANTKFQLQLLGFVGAEP